LAIPIEYWFIDKVVLLGPTTDGRFFKTLSIGGASGGVVSTGGPKSAVCSVVHDASSTGNGEIWSEVVVARVACPER